MDIKARLKNYGFWVSLAAFILLILQTAGVQIAPDKYNEIVTAILSVFVALGILNNPKDGTGYFDTKQQ